jgi:hypothetical protein
MHQIICNRYVINQSAIARNLHCALQRAQLRAVINTPSTFTDKNSTKKLVQYPVAQDQVLHLLCSYPTTKPSNTKATELKNLPIELAN